MCALEDQTCFQHVKGKTLWINTDSTLRSGYKLAVKCGHAHPTEEGGEWESNQVQYVALVH